MRRRFMKKKPKEPQLVLRTNQGTDMTYNLLSGYKYMDLLIIGGGGGGGLGYKSLSAGGGGGGSGSVVYVENFNILLMSQRRIKYTLATPASYGEDGNSTDITIDGNTLKVGGGKAGKEGSTYKPDGGDGGTTLLSDIQTVLLPYVSGIENIACSSNGGGGGAVNNSSGSAHANAGSGATISGAGMDGTSSGAGEQVINDDGTGGNDGGRGRYAITSAQTYASSGGKGTRLNQKVIPIKTKFRSSAKSGIPGYTNGGGSGGVAYGNSGNGGDVERGKAGEYGSGGGGGSGYSASTAYGGQGGPGLIAIYYHD